MSSGRSKSVRPGRREIGHAPTERAMPSAPKIPVPAIPTPAIPRERSPGFRSPTPGATERVDDQPKKRPPPQR